MAINRTVEPTFEPVSLAEMKNHAREDDHAFDLSMNGALRAAVRAVENETRRQLVTATWVLKLDRFPSDDGAIYLPRPPLQSVTTITYTDVDGNAGTSWASSKYDVDTDSIVGRVCPGFGESYPATREVVNAVIVTYAAGYANQSQEARLFPRNIEISDVFAIQVEGEEVATFTALAATVSSVVTGLQAAFTYAGVTAADSTTYLKLTGTSGVPFDVTGTATEGGSADTQELAVTYLARATAVPETLIGIIKMAALDLYERPESRTELRLMDNPTYASMLAEYIIEEFA